MALCQHLYKRTRLKLGNGSLLKKNVKMNVKNTLKLLSVIRSLGHNHYVLYEQPSFTP